MVYKNSIKLLLCWQSKLQSGEPKRRWYRIHPRDLRSQLWRPEKFSVALLLILYVGSSIYRCRSSLAMTSCVMLPHVRSGIFHGDSKYRCRWSKRSAKKNILSVAKVVTFEAKPKLWGMEDWSKWCKENTHWMRRKAFPVGIDDMACCSFSINFCASSSSCCCIIMANLPSLMIIFPCSPDSAPPPVQVTEAPSQAEHLWRYPCYLLVG